MYKKTFDFANRNRGGPPKPRRCRALEDPTPDQLTPATVQRLAEQLERRARAKTDDQKREARRIDLRRR